MAILEWKANVLKAREGKNAFFAEHWQSPIPPQDRPRFKGLEYYPPDPNCRFKLELHEHREKQVVSMAYSKGNEQDFIRWGEFRLKISAKEQTLQTYKSNPEEKTLFIPFKDATSGKETYGAGRYLDLKPDRDCAQEGKWILDFNQAYNPWCVYIAKLIPVLLCPARIGSKFQPRPVRKTIL